MDADGHFAICLFLHDSDTIELTVEAPGFAAAAAAPQPHRCRVRHTTGPWRTPLPRNLWIW